MTIIKQVFKKSSLQFEFKMTFMQNNANVLFVTINTRGLSTPLNFQSFLEKLFPFKIRRQIAANTERAKKQCFQFFSADCSALLEQKLLTKYKYVNSTVSRESF